MTASRATVALLGCEDRPQLSAAGRLTRDQQKTITFQQPGTYTYHCVYHRCAEATVTVR